MGEYQKGGCVTAKPEGAKDMTCMTAAEVKLMEPTPACASTCPEDDPDNGDDINKMFESGCAKDCAADVEQAYRKYIASCAGSSSSDTSSDANSQSVLSFTVLAVLLGRLAF